MTTQTFLLAQHDILRTNSKDLISQQVAQFLCPHRMRLMGDPTLSSRLCGLMLEHLSIIELQYGARVEIDPGEMSDVFLFRLTLEGQGDITYRNKVVPMNKGGITVSSPSEHGLIHTLEDCHNIVVRVERAALEQRLSLRLGHRFSSPIVFDHYFAPDHPGTGYVKSTVEYVAQVARHLNKSACLRLQMRRMEEFFLDSLLDLFAHNFTSQLSGQESALPHYVKTAKEYIDHHLTQPITLIELAGVAKVSVRSLQYAFKQFLHISPKEYVLRERMRAIHRALASADSQAKVTDIVLAHGVNSLGHFATQYKAVYGLTPQETLKRQCPESA